MMKIIGIAGKAGAGKDTLRRELHELFYEVDFIKTGYVVTQNFADPLKATAAELFDIPIDAFYDPKVKEIPDHYWEVSPRQIAQFFGTEMVRETMGKLLFGIGENFWIKRLEKTVDLSSDDILIIADVRFQNEYEWILANNGVVINIIRPGADGMVGISNHPSEAGFLIHEGDAVCEIFNDGTIEQLAAQAVNFIKSHWNL